MAKAADGNDLAVSSNPITAANQAASAAAATEAAAATSSANNAAKLDAEIAPEEQEAVSDLNSGNYAGAWSTALSTSSLFGTNYSSATSDPLLQAMESSSGLQELDPSKTWNASSIAAYDAALGNNAVYQGQTVAGMGGGAESLGQNPYGDWGSGAALTGGKDAATNSATAGDNSAPDVERFAGAVPSTSFLSKYGADIAALVATVATAGAGAPALAAALAGSAAADVVNAAQGKLTATGAIEGLATAALGAEVAPLGSALGSATGVGATAGTAAVGAGVGAGTAALTGGNALTGAITGGVSGAIQGSGIVKTAGNAVGSALGGGTLANAAGAGLVGGGLGAATGAGVAALTGGNVANSALTGGVSGALKGAVGSATGSGALGSVAGGLGTMAISPLLSSGSSVASSGSSVASNGSGSAVGSNTGAGYDFSSTSSTLGSLLGPALQSAAGIYGSQNAAEDQENAINNAENTELGQLSSSNALYGSAVTAQNTALANVNNIYGAQAAAGNNADTQIQQLEGGTSTPADYSNFYNSPGYQFAISQGTQAIDRQAAATGAAYTPNTLDTVGQYVTGTADQNYNNYMSQLQNTAALGAQANTGLAGANTTVATNLAGIANNQATNQSGINSNIAQLQQNSGVAAANGVLGASGAASSIAGGIGNGISSLLGLGGSNNIGGLSSNASGVTSAAANTAAGLNANGTASVDPTTTQLSSGDQALVADNAQTTLDNATTFNSSGWNTDGSINTVNTGTYPGDAPVSGWLDLGEDD